MLTWCNDVMFDNFMEADSGLVTRETITEGSILAALVTPLYKETSDDEDGSTKPAPPPSMRDGIHTLSQVRIMLQNRDVESSVIEIVDNIETVSMKSIFVKLLAV